MDASEAGLIHNSSGQDWEVYCDPQRPETLVMLKNVELMDYLDRFQIDQDENNRPSTFPNYYVLSRVSISHRQKKTLWVMLKQPTCPRIMVAQFCRLARKYYPDEENQIGKMEELFSYPENVKENEVLQWYSLEIFFYKLLNRLLRAGRDSTQLFYGQHFVKLLAQAINSVYLKQKKEQNRQVSGKFTCFRGAYFTEQEIDELKQSEGKHIETLGFLSTSLKKEVAMDFIVNSLVEIEVSDSPKDEEIDVGYVVMTGEYTKNEHEQEVLFNVLSSFLVKSVQRQEKEGLEFWCIKLEYGVTYEMMKKYKENRRSQDRGTEEQQLMLSVLSWQDVMKSSFLQEQCLLEEGAIEEYYQMAKNRIDLLGSLPQLSDLVEGEQMLLYNILSFNQEKEGKHREFMRQMEQKLKKSSWDNDEPSQQVASQIHNLRSTQILVLQHFSKKEFRECKQQILNWKKCKQKLLAGVERNQLIETNSRIFEDLEQTGAEIDGFQFVTNIELFAALGEKEQLKQEIKKAQGFKQQLLEKYGRFHPSYGMLSKCLLQHSYKIGQVSRECYLNGIHETLMLVSGAKQDKAHQFKVELIQNEQKICQHLKRGQWTKAVNLCIQQRDRQFGVKGEEDCRFFQSIIYHLNKIAQNLGEKIQILYACLCVAHPHKSAFEKTVRDAWAKYRTKQKQREEIYVDKIRKGIGGSGREFYEEVVGSKKEMEQDFGKVGLCYLVNQCLIVNCLRMAGKYEQANIYFDQVKSRISTSEHPQFYKLLKLDKFEEVSQFSK